MSAVPIIQATTCPSVADLGNKANGWAIVRSTSGHSYVGRLRQNAIAPTGHAPIDDPFDYYSKRELAGDPKSPRLGMQRQIFPVEHFDIDEIVVQVAEILAFSRLSPRALESIRDALIPAWEGREHLRKHGGRLELVGASTKIEAP